MKKILLVALLLNFANVFAQGASCFSIPSKFGVSFGQSSVVSVCDPATYGLTYEYIFSEQIDFTVPGLNLTVRVDYGDGVTDIETVNIGSTDLTIDAGGRHVYSHTFNHTFPGIADMNYKCSYEVKASFYVDGTKCTSTEEATNIANFSNDNNRINGSINVGTEPTPGGGLVSRIQVCEGTSVNISQGDIKDYTDFNCVGNSASLTGSGATSGVEINTERRWRQIVYNPSVADGGTVAVNNKIPSISVNGAMMTDAMGGDMESNYTTGGVHRRDPASFDGYPRPTVAGVTSLPIAVGSVGKEFEIQFRYWNVCNKYYDGAVSAGLPTDIFNGDNEPVMASVIIEVVAAPEAPTVANPNELYCGGLGGASYIVRATTTLTSPTFRWYDLIPSDPAAIQRRVNVGTATSFFFPTINASLSSTSTSTVSGSYYVTVEGTSTTPGATKICVSPPSNAQITIYPVINPGELESEMTNASSQTICSGQIPEKIVSKVAPSGSDGNYTYVWKQYVGAMVTDVGTTEEYTPAALTETTTYRREVTGFNGVAVPALASNTCKTAITAGHTVTVILPVGSAGMIGSSQSICGGERPSQIQSIVATSGGTLPYVYQWESSSTSATGPFTAITGANAVNYQPLTLSVNTWYRRGVRSSRAVAACGVSAPPTQYTNTVAITVTPTFNPGSIAIAGSAMTTICSGATMPIIMETTSPPAPPAGSTYTYSWSQSENSGGPYSPIVAGLNIGSPYTPPTTTRTRYYVRTAALAGGATSTCTATTSEVAIMVNPLPATIATGGGNKCGTAAAPAVVLTAQGDNGPWVIEYTYTPTTAPMTPVSNTVTVGTALSLAASETISTPSIGTYTITNVTDNVGCEAIINAGSPPSATIIGLGAGTTGAAPTVDTFESQIPVCDAKVATDPPDAVIALTSMVSGSYSVTYDITSVAGVKVERVVNMNSTSNGIMNIVHTYADVNAWNGNSGDVMIKLKSIRDLVSGCQTTITAAPDETTLTVVGVPEIMPGQLTSTCSGQPSAYTVSLSTSSVMPTSYSIDRLGVASVTSPGASYVINDILTNDLVTDATVVYRVTPINSPATLMPTTTCRGKEENVTITVRPLPEIRTGQSFDVCEGSTGNIKILLSRTPASSPVNLTWIDPTMPAPSTQVTVPSSAVSHITNTFAPTNPAPMTTVLTYNVTPETVIGCVGTEEPVSVNIYPFPTLPADAADRVCTGTALAHRVILTGADNNTGLMWTDPDPAKSGTVQTVLYGDATAMPPSDHITDVYANTSTTFVNYIYRIRGVASGNTTCVTPTATQYTATVDPLPVAIDQTISVCEDVVGGMRAGSGTVDLNALEAAVTNSATDVEVLWYEDVTLMTIIPTPTNYRITSTETVYANISYTAASGRASSCSQYASVDLQYQPAPSTNIIVHNGPGSLTRKATATSLDEYVVCTTDAVGAATTPPTLANHTLSPSNGVSGATTFAWDFSPPAIVEVTGTRNSNTLSLAFDLTKKTSDADLTITFSLIETTVGSGCSAPANEIKVIVTDGAATPTIVGPALVCSGAINTTYELRGVNVSRSVITWDLPTGFSFSSSVFRGQDNINLNFTDDISNIVMAGGGATSYTASIAVKVEEGAGSCVVSPATPLEVTVIQTPSMNMPITDFVMCSGSNVNSRVTLAAIGGEMPISYNWSAQSIATGVNGVSLGDTGSGVSNIDLTLSNISGNDATANFRITPLGPVVGAIGAIPGISCSGTPALITINVKPEPVIVPNQVAEVCSEEAINYSIQTNPVGLPTGTTFSWADPDVMGPLTAGVNVPIASAVHISDVPINTTAMSTRARYVINASSPGDLTVMPILPNCDATTAGVPVEITVNPMPIGSNATIDVCSSSILDYDLQDNINGAGPNVISSFSWSATSNPNVGGASTGTSLNSKINDVLTNYTLTNQVVVYRVTPSSDVGGCTGASFNITVNVHPEPIGINDMKTICSSTPVAYNLIDNLSNTVRGANRLVTGTTYNVTRMTVFPIGVTLSTDAIMATDIEDVLKNVSISRQNVVYNVVPTNNMTPMGGSPLACEGSSFNVTVQLQPQPDGVNETLTICSQQALSVDLGDIINRGNRLPNNTFSWSSVSAANPAGQMVTGATVNGNADNITDLLQNTSSAILTTMYTITPTSEVLAPLTTGCTGDDFTVAIRVRPEPVAGPPVNPSTTTCSKVPLAIAIAPRITAGNGVNSTYRWRATDNSTVSGESLATSTGGTINDILENTSSSTETVTYDVSPSSLVGDCLGADFQITVDVNPEPVFSDNASLIICSSISTGLGYDLNTSNINNLASTFSWVATPTADVDGESSTRTSGGSITDMLVNNLMDAKRVVYTVTPTSQANNCVGENYEVSVLVRPRPTINNIPAQFVCSEESLSIPFSFNLPNAIASWTWTSSDPAGTITNVVDGIGRRLDVAPTNTTLNVASYTYTITPEFSACRGASITVGVTVNPVPEIMNLPPSITVCNGQNIDIPIQGNVATATYSWEVEDKNSLETIGFFNGMGDRITRTFNNNTGAQANLIYRVTPMLVSGGVTCQGPIAYMSIAVPSILADVEPSSEAICSGNSLQVVNKSSGVSDHSWYYRRTGTTDRIDVRTTASVSYTLENNTASNPIEYEIVYQGSSSGCMVSEIITPSIKVYRSLTAKIGVPSVIPPLVGGVSQVKYENESFPIDAQNYFDFEWTFGLPATTTPSVSIQTDPTSVTYETQGTRDVSLLATNKSINTGGLACESRTSVSVTIPVEPLTADFDIESPRSCLPFDVSVVNNSTGAVNQWTLTDPTGRTVATSRLNTPTFEINMSGTYVLFLTTSDPFVPQSSETTSRTFQAYNTPKAEFELRPSTVFVPDTKMYTNNLSTEANFYRWDFGNGDTSDEEEPVYVYTRPGTYNVSLVAGFRHTDGQICRDTLVTTINARQGGTILPPNAFTPDPNNVSSSNTGPIPPGTVPGQDGVGGGVASFNDVFLPIVQGVESFNMQIFDRWGNLVYQTNSATEGWNGRDGQGRLMPVGVYVYRLEVQLSDGQRNVTIGDVTMMR